MRIRGLERLPTAELERGLPAGGRFVVYEYCISLVCLSLRRPSAVYFVRNDLAAWLQGLPYALVTFLAGWWGIPWGLIYTPLALATDLTGGVDVTEEVLAYLQSKESG
ncbi:MAG: hypothetical protein NZ700_01920 [Gemmataceae bacterium]|nr:hypothetical protein [Gemmataceae bacterium]MDW8264835.1 hypothetical protein [Gemmataceae bacterium]